MSVLSALGFDTGRITKEGLKRLNLLIGILFLIEAVALLLIGNAGNGTRPVNLGYTSQDALSSTVAGHQVFLPAAHHFFDISLLYIIGFILILAGLANILSATFWRSTYEADINKGLNRLRWRQSAVIGGLAMVALALLVGASDLSLLLLIFGSIVGFNVLGLLLEQIKQRLQVGEKLKFWASLMPAVVAWLAVAIYVASAYIYGTKVPAYIYIIPAVMLALFVLSAIVRYKHYHKAAPWNDYMYVERTYIALNFISLSALAWMIYGWILH